MARGGFDINYENTQFKKRFKDYKNNQEGLHSSYPAIEIKKGKYQYIEYMLNNGIVLDMIDTKHKDADVDFKRQVKKIKPETQEYINSIIKTFEASDLNIEHLGAKDLLVKMKELK